MSKQVTEPFNPEWWQWNDDETALICTPAGRALNQWLSSQPLKVVEEIGDFTVADVISN